LCGNRDRRQHHENYAAKICHPATSVAAICWRKLAMLDYSLLGRQFRPGGKGMTFLPHLLILQIGRGFELTATKTFDADVFTAADK